MKRCYLAALLLFALLCAGCAARSERPAESPAPDAAVTPAPTPTPSPAPTPEPTPEPADEAERLLRDMSAEEKVAQLLLFCCHDATQAEGAAASGVGGLCLYADAFAGKEADEVRAMTDALQAAAPLPLLLAVDEEGGTVCRISVNRALRAQPFDSPFNLLHRGGWAAIEQDADEKCALLQSLGLNVNLAPVADVPRSGQDYIAPRALSNDASEVAAYVSRVVLRMNEAGVGCVLKHFPGYGGSRDTHTGGSIDERSREEFLSRDYLPFAAGIQVGAPAVLVSHVTVPALFGELPASLSSDCYRSLREDLGFTGVILCDDLVMDALAEYPNAAAMAAEAGCDLLCVSDYESAQRQILAALEAGDYAQPQLDASVLRVLRWKQALGLLPAAD